MKIKQFEDKGLAHYSYAILSECESQIVLIDPSRNITEYLEYAKEHDGKIIGVIETHPHADFVSGHLELHKVTGAILYCSKLVGAAYTHQGFDDGDVISFGKIKLKSLNTPGHSPDSISIVLEHDGKDKAVFTGDTLFIGDCGRPDLRENAGNVTAKREELAVQMYHSLREKLMPLANEVIVYPAHGAGTLCGKALSDANHSTIGAEKISNWSLKEMTEQAFIKELTADQPFVPKYFPYDVGLNKEGANDREKSLSAVRFGASDGKSSSPKVQKEFVIIDTRPAAEYRKGHHPNSINLMYGGKFETWLGSIVTPHEGYILAADSQAQLELLIEKTAKIGYETFIKEAIIITGGPVSDPEFDPQAFKANPEAYTILDVRNPAEAKEHPVFKHAINIPLYQLRERVKEIPIDKPIAVHCASGYRSAAGTSIVADAIHGTALVYDISDDIKTFLEH
ncbi:rhodanese-like domain-containing protein [Mucilaginibacter sp. 10I4]|uniref:rhodanese-like domain-containing protein n=1 Tax=Mucilaginibacter sp. 10I4 TaxID=3048580 RepID=UPI002B23DF73|nr:rhodanese-like domain-containing protein [Mucilaginibacter sp. 10I4]MEB0260714.1 MBL fold metallo-hydrolase [Mucilaginibacter sp. 10I4]